MRTTWYNLDSWEIWRKFHRSSLRPRNVDLQLYKKISARRYIIALCQISYKLSKNGYKSLVRRVICLKGVVQIPKFDAKPKPNLNPNPNPMPIRFGQMTLQTMTLRTSELSPFYFIKRVEFDFVTIVCRPTGSAWWDVQHLSVKRERALKYAAVALLTVAR